MNSTHPDYDDAALDWSRARDVLAGEDAVKAGGWKYLPRLDSQTDEEFAAYVKRASFFNATARTSEAYHGLIFRRPPFVKLSGDGGAQGTARPTGVGQAMQEFVNDADMLGTSLTGYAKMVVGDVIGLGRAGTLVDWEEEAEQRAYAAFYRAEQIINWRVERVRGRNVPTLIVLRETSNIQHPTSNVEQDGARGDARPPEEGDDFEPQMVEQIRVLRLVVGDDGDAFCRVDFQQHRGDDDVQQAGYAADHFARCASDAGEVWRVDPGREQQRAAGESMKWLWTILMLASATAAGAERQTLAWDPSPSADVVGYRVYYGTNTRSYQFVTNAGLVLTQAVVLPFRGRWFFAATAYSSNGLESDFSSEVSWESKPAPPVMAGEPWVRLAPVFGRSTNLTTWGSVTGTPSWFPATNRAEFFRMKGLVMERVRVP